MVLIDIILIKYNKLVNFLIGNGIDVRSNDDNELFEFNADINLCYNIINKIIMEKKLI